VSNRQAGDRAISQLGLAVGSFANVGITQNLADSASTEEELSAEEGNCCKRTSVLQEEAKHG
jgi:hypothetical protein